MPPTVTRPLAGGAPGPAPIAPPPRAVAPPPPRANPTPPRATPTVPAPTAPAPTRPVVPARLTAAAAPVAPAAPSHTTRTAVIPPPGVAERGPSLNPKLGPPAAADPRFERALEHLRERRWAQARPLLSELSAGAPTDVRHRAYLHDLRGWEAFELGKDGEARAEWRRALACDPGLGMAQSGRCRTPAWADRGAPGPSSPHRGAGGRTVAIGALARFVM